MKKDSTLNGFSTNKFNGEFKFQILASLKPHFVILPKMFNQFPLDQSQYQILHDIGNSSDATVVLARCIPNNKLVAIKQIDLETCNVTFDQLANEIKFCHFYGGFLN